MDPQSSLFDLPLAPRRPLPEGFRDQPDLITTNEERALISQFEHLDFKPKNTSAIWAIGASHRSAGGAKRTLSRSPLGFGLNARLRLSRAAFDRPLPACRTAAARFEDSPERRAPLQGSSSR